MACCNYATQRKAIHDESWKLRNYTLYPVKRKCLAFNKISHGKFLRGYL